MIFYNIKNRAFTLVELVIIVVIIGILVTIGFLNFSSQRQLAKDTVRAQDLKTISNLLDLAYAKKGGFPEPSAERMEGGQLKLETIDGKDFKTGTFGGTDIINLYGEEASKIPKDPKDKETEYFYSLSTDGRFYLLRAQLEDNRTYALANYMTSQGTDILALNTGTGTGLPGQQTPPGNGGGNQGGGNQGGGNQGGGNPPGNGNLPPIPEPPANTTPISCFQVRKESTKTVIRGYTCTDQDVVIPNTIFGSPVKEIAANAFKGKNLRSVISHSVEVIGNFAFFGNQLEYIYFPAVTKVGNYAFVRNINLTSISLERVTHIGDYAFGAQVKRERVCVPHEQSWRPPVCTDTGPWILCGSSKPGSSCVNSNNVEEINLPSVEHIGVGAFQDNQLVNLDLPTLKTIGDKAFSGESLSPIGPMQTVNLPNIKSIGNSAFYNQSLREVNLNTSTDIDRIGINAFAGKDHPKSTIKVRINSLQKVKEIGEAAFKNTLIEGGVDLSSVTKIGKSAFAYSGIEGNITIPNIEIIEDNAFALNKLTSVNLPLVTEIKQYAFQNNQQLTSINFPKIEKIHTSAFGSTGFRNITLPNTLKYISGYSGKAFGGAPVQTVVNKSTLPNNTVKGAFDGNPTITN